jgi:hypothetical protein
MVVLFRSIEEAELRRNVPGHEEALVLAQSISSRGDAVLREECDRLLALCAERLRTVQAIALETAGRRLMAMPFVLTVPGSSSAAPSAAATAGARSF